MGTPTRLSYKAVDLASGKTVATAVGESGVEVTLEIADPVLWSPAHPHLYDLEVAVLGAADAAGAAVTTAAARPAVRPVARLAAAHEGAPHGGSTAGRTDSVLSYFALRTFTLGTGPKTKGKRPGLHGNFTVLIGMLDQS
jgi:hypothetical protein